MEKVEGVLLFPPVNNYYRFLIHQTCETYTKQYDIVTISIGSLVRRTVVCYRKQLKDSSKLGSSYLNGGSASVNTTTSSDTRKPQPRSWRNPTPSTALTMGVEKLQLNKSQSVDTQRPPDIEDRRTTASSLTVVTNGLLTTTTATTAATRTPTTTTDPNSKEEDIHINSSSESNKSQRIRRERRPDRAVYVPRARRSITTPPQVTNNTLEPLTPSPTNGELPLRPKKTKLITSVAKTKSPYIDENVNLVNMSTKTNSKSPPSKTGVLRIDGGTDNHKDNDNDLVELKRASSEINRSNRRIIKQTFVSDVLEIPDIQKTTTKTTKHKSKTKKSDSLKTKEKNHKNSEFVEQNDSVSCDPETDDWDTMFDDNGECLDPKIIEELSASVGKVKIETPKMDYTAYHIKQELLNEEEYPHVLEVSNFPAEFKTPDLLMLFNPYKQSGYDIKWVDDTHALVVFSSSKIAAQALATGHPFVVLKPLAEATLESRIKSKKCAESMQPYKARPETCAALARRLVTGALGVRLKTAAAERENEKRVLREAKERKLLAAKQRDEAWES